MRPGTSDVSKGLIFGFLAGLLWLGVPPQARAQNGNLFCPDGFFLQNGSCTSKPGVVDPAGFSGAALASQALSELSQTTTQETNRTMETAIKDRRELEELRCAPGFSRVDGACEPRPSAAELAPPAAVSPPPSPERPETPTRKAHKAMLAAKRTKAAKAPPKAPVHKFAPKIAVRQEPGPPPLALPPPIEPGARFATWTQIYGDHERRSATGTVVELVTPPPGFSTQQVGLDLNVHSQTGTIGFLAGGDFTSRGVLYGNDGLIAGAMAGFVSSHLNLQTTATPNTPVSGCAGNCTGVSHNFAKLTGPSAGLYATYFNGGFSTDVSLKVDALSLNENFDDWVTLFAPGFAPFGVPVSPSPTIDRQALVLNGGSTHLLNTTLAGNVNYRFDLQNNLWIEPTAGVQYINSSYASDAAQLGLADGNLVMVQGGARFGTNFLLCGWVRTTAILTGLAYDDVLVKGGFVAGAGFLANNLLAQADQGQVRGRGIVALNFDFGQGISSFVQGEARGGKGLFGAGGKAGVRVQW
jgi:hypothetical protein